MLLACCVLLAAADTLGQDAGPTADVMTEDTKHRQWRGYSAYSGYGNYHGFYGGYPYAGFYGGYPYRYYRWG